jgi:hypothetical protein
MWEASDHPLASTAPLGFPDFPVLCVSVGVAHGTKTESFSGMILMKQS